MFNHCLCSPLWVVQQDLRIGETRLLQVAFPELPAAAGVRRRQPGHPAAVRPRPGEPVGTAPVARQPTDLARPAEPVPAGRHRRRVPLSPTSRPRQSIQIDQRHRGARPNHQWSGPCARSRPDHRPSSRLRAAGLQPAAGRRPGAEHQPGQRARRLTRRAAASLVDALDRPPGLRPAGVRVPVHRTRPLGLRAAGRGGCARSDRATIRPCRPAPGRSTSCCPGFGTFRAVPVVERRGRGGERSVRPRAGRRPASGTYSTEDPPTGWSTRRLADRRCRTPPSWRTTERRGRAGRAPCLAAER